MLQHSYLHKLDPIGLKFVGWFWPWLGRHGIGFTILLWHTGSSLDLLIAAHFSETRRCFTYFEFTFFFIFLFLFLCIQEIEWHIPFWATQTMLVQYIWPRSLGNVMICLQFLVPHLNLCLSGAAERGEQLVGVQECPAQRVPSPPPEDLPPRGAPPPATGREAPLNPRPGQYNHPSSSFWPSHFLLPLVLPLL